MGYGSTGPTVGLSTAEAISRFKRFGPNALDALDKESFLSVLFTQAKNVIFLLTMIAAAISYSMNDHIKAYCLIGIVLVVCFLNAVGEYTGQDASGEVAKLAAARASVMRDGIAKHVDVKALVPGDVVFLKAGDVVPADLLMLNCQELYTDESLLTGEPSEVLKTEQPKDPAASFPTNVAYASTPVVAGTGMGEVLRTGMHTQVGLIAKQLAPPTKTLNPLQKSINMLGGVIGGICLAIVVVASVISYIKRYQNPAHPCPDDDDHCFLMRSVLSAIIMAVSIIPHGLPLVVMIMLRVGAHEMAKRNAIVIRRTAVDYLGATTVVCTDKTGTLTEGKMTAELLTGFVRPSDPSARPAEPHKFSFYPLKGFHPSGGVFLTTDLTSQARERMDQLFDLTTETADYNSVVPDLGQRGSTGSEAALARVQLTATFMSCHGTPLVKDERGVWHAVGNMSEAALKVAAAKARLRDGDVILGATYTRVAELEVPFTSQRKLSASVYHLQSPETFEALKLPQGVTHLGVIKGAPERLLSHLGGKVMQWSSDDKLVLGHGPLSEAEKDNILNENQTLADCAFRTLLLAVAPIDVQTLEKLRSATVPDERTDILLALGVFVGIYGIADPPRTTVPPSIKECHTAGIRVVMITGDQEATAAAIGRKVNILHECDDVSQRVKLCARLHESDEVVKPGPRPKLKLQKTRSVHDLDTRKGNTRIVYKGDMTLDEMVSETRCWARAQPTDKVAIVESLTCQGHIASMTGDGVNDAPALKRAAIGVAMGIQGTCVAQAAADIVLGDDNFSTIVSAIKEGRKIYANVQKYVLFNLSIKGGECISLLFAIIFGIPLPIFGLQLLFNLIATHIIPTFSLAFEDVEEYTMRIAPRNTKRDWIIYRTQWLYRWLPFIICMASCVLSCTYLGTWMHVGFAVTWQLIGTSHIDYVDKGVAACEFAGHLSDDGSRFIEDDAPFHCRCIARAYPWAEPVVIEEWGRAGAEEAVAEAFDPRFGMTKDVYERSNTPFKDGRGTLLRECSGPRGNARWCWINEGMEKPLLDTMRSCASFGTKRGQTMGFVSIMFGEITSLLTYRRDGFSFPCFFTNQLYVYMFIFNLIMMFTFLYIRPISELLGLLPLPLPFLTIALSFGVLLPCLNELFKIRYRMVHLVDILHSEDIAKRAAKGEIEPWVDA